MPSCSRADFLGAVGRVATRWAALCGGTPPPTRPTTEQPWNSCCCGGQLSSVLPPESRPEEAYPACKLQLFSGPGPEAGERALGGEGEAPAVADWDTAQDHSGAEDCGEYLLGPSTAVQPPQRRIHRQGQAGPCTADQPQSSQPAGCLAVQRERAPSTAADRRGWKQGGRRRRRRRQPDDAEAAGGSGGPDHGLAGRQ